MPTWDELNSKAGAKTPAATTNKSVKRSWDDLNAEAKKSVASRPVVSEEREPQNIVIPQEKPEGILSGIKKAVAKPFIQGGQAISGGVLATSMLAAGLKKKFQGKEITEAEKAVFKGTPVDSLTPEQRATVDPEIAQISREISSHSEGLDLGQWGAAKPYETPAQAALGGAAMATNVANMPVRAAKVASGVLRGAVAPVVKESVKAAPLAGLGSGLTAASQGMTPEEIAKETAIGTAVAPIIGTGVGVPLALAVKGAGAIARPLVKGVTDKARGVLSKTATDAPVPTSIVDAPVAPKAGIEESVVQRINVKTGEKEYKVIPKGQLKKFTGLIDQPGGAAGHVVDETQWHITADAPTTMESEGFKYAGVADKAEVPRIAGANAGTVADKPFVSRVSQRMAQENPDVVESVGYTPIKLREQAQKAVDLIDRDPRGAYRVAMGATDAPAYEAVNTNIALSEQALREGNNDLAAQLIRQRSLAQTERGQAIVSEKSSLTDNSTSRYVKELLSERLTNLGRRTEGIMKNVFRKSKADSGIKRIKSEVSKAKQAISHKQMDIEAAQKLIDSLTCK